jgi:phosphate starvation-inducible protein PhoH and related proteins
VQGIAHSRFTSQDVVRHPLVARIVDAYEAAQAQAQAQLGVVSRRKNTKN